MLSGDGKVIKLSSCSPVLSRDMIESCGWDRKRTFFIGKVLLPPETSSKENVRETEKADEFAYQCQNRDKHGCLGYGLFLKYRRDVQMMLQGLALCFKVLES